MSFSWLVERTTESKAESKLTRDAYLASSSAEDIAGTSFMDEIKRNFPSSLKSWKCKSHFFQTMSTVYIYSNDIQLVGGYREKLRRLCTIEKEKEIKLHPSDPPYRKVGFIIGNGYIISLLPFLFVDNVLLFDINPVVSFFVLHIADLILQTPKEEEFAITQSRLIKNITEVEDEIEEKNLFRSERLSTEMESLGELHFLSSKDQFEKCRNALLRKKLIPVTGNFFDIEFMTRLGTQLRKFNAKITFLSLTNLLDYDHLITPCGKTSLTVLPVAANCTSIFTFGSRLVGTDYVLGMSSDLEWYQFYEPGQTCIARGYEEMMTKLGRLEIFQSAIKIIVTAQNAFLGYSVKSNRENFRKISDSINTVINILKIYSLTFASGNNIRETLNKLIKIKIEIETDAIDNLDKKLIIAQLEGLHELAIHTFNFQRALSVEKIVCNDSEVKSVEEKNKTTGSVLIRMFPPVIKSEDNTSTHTPPPKQRLVCSFD